MEQGRNWLDEIILVNEGPEDDEDLREVMLFFGADRALSHLRRSRSRACDLSGFSGAGERLVFGPDESGALAIIGRERVAGGELIAARWLRAHVDPVLDKRRENALLGRGNLLPFEECGALPETVEGQLAYLRMAENALLIDSGAVGAS